MRALIVEDTPPLRRLVRLALERIEGMSVEEAENGAEGLRKLVSGQFDIVMADLHMPVMDGLKMIRAIRALPDDRSKVPIIVITADEDEEQRSLDAGATAYTVKPIQVPRLIETVKKVLGMPEEPAP